MRQQLEIVKSNQQLIALIVRAGFPAKANQFLTQPDNPLQLGLLKFAAGHTIAPHLHRALTKTTHLNQEFLYLISGQLEIKLFNKQKKLLFTTILNQGDILLQLSGGHGFKVLKTSKLITIKQGPYRGTALEKSFITSAKP